ncbi:MAG: methionyl-tRNA formyltransferase [Firmicutes bacterium]|nr:methionyl-tRNA formyltransferase [Bacillota bacterium]
MRVAFFGTPEFGIPILESLMKSSHELVCVVTQPDRPVGRGGKVIHSAVKDWAIKNNIPVIQPERISKEIELLEPFSPDVIITAAFGQMLRQNVLDYPKYGVINVHTSLLPKYRGSSPVHWAIMKGETTTGITTMQTDIGMDTGDIIMSKSIQIDENENCEELTKRLSFIGAELIVTTLDSIENGTAKRTPQNHDEASHYPMLKKEDGRIDWTRSAKDINNQIRGLNPWPIAYFEYNGEQFRVYKANIVDDKELRGRAGKVLVSDTKNGLAIQCGAGILEPLIVQSSGGKRLGIKDFLNGRRFELGSILD